MEHLEDLYKKVGQRIRRVRETRRFTQAELALKVSMTRTSITNIEQGRQKLLLHTLYDIADALGVEPSTLLPNLTQPSEAEVFEQSEANDLSHAEKEWIRSIVTASERN